METRMRILELFRGTQSLAKAARAHGHSVTTLDICPRHAPDICADVLLWEPSDHYAPDAFDYIHASCPCENYSICNTIGTRNLELADAVVEKTIKILRYFGGALWTVENPRKSQLWRRPVARPLVAHLATTSYCRYGFAYMKTTTFAHHPALALHLRPPCDRTGGCGQMRYGKHLEHAQRGGGGACSKRHTCDELHRIPWGLCCDIVESVERS